MRILATSSRPPFEDMQPLSSAFSTRNVSKNIALAGIIAANQTLLEYDRHMQLETSDEYNGEVFDWDSSISRSVAKFQYDVMRLQSTSVVRKLIELYSLENMPTKFTSRITKDVAKSLRRKLLKFSQWDAAQRIFYTSLWANAPTYVSMLVFDFAEHVVRSMYSMYQHLSQNKAVSLQVVGNGLINFLGKLSVLLLKKGIVYTACWTASATGYSLGCYYTIVPFISQESRAFVGATVCEVAAGTIVGLICA